MSALDLQLQEEIDSTPPVNGRFGRWGGRYVPETLVPALDALEESFTRFWHDAAFRSELDELLRTYVGRATPLYRARRLGEVAGGATIYLKREDLTHTGSHKLNNALGQALLARAMGKRQLLAETGAGQHGVATATAAALLGLPCRIYMGTEDMHRQRLNVHRMQLLGAQVVPVESGSCTLKDATSQAIRDWMGSFAETHYVIGSVVGPHPYPWMVRTLQSVIGQEARGQILQAAGRLPDALIACVGGGSNAAGLFHAFAGDRIEMIGVEAGGDGDGAGRHSASISSGSSPGVLHGALSRLLQDSGGQVSATHSLAAGLDYPGVGPEHAWLHETGLARYTAVSDAEAMEAFETLSRLEGIIPAMESSHAVAHALRLGRELGPGAVLLVCLSGRGDKDLGRDVAAADGPDVAGAASRRRQDHPPTDRAHQPPSAAGSRCHDSAAGSRLAERFEACRGQGRAALVAYLAAGDPDLAATERLALAAERGGADVLELGIPFSDPLADGPVIQAACTRALGAGACVAGLLQSLGRIRERCPRLPIVLMGALNPILAYGMERFCRDAASAGADGLLVGDLLPEDAGELLSAMRQRGLASVFLATPDTSAARLASAARASTGFLYLVSRRGVTGAGGGIGADGGAGLEQAVARARSAGSAPVCVGFGISTPAQAMQVAKLADGVIVGSALVEAAHEACAAGGLASAEQAVERAVAELARAVASVARLLPSAAR